MPDPEDHSHTHKMAEAVLSLEEKEFRVHKLYDDQLLMLKRAVDFMDKLNPSQRSAIFAAGTGSVTLVQG